MDSRSFEFNVGEFPAAWWTIGGLVWSKENVVFLHVGIYDLDFDREFLNREVYSWLLEVSNGFRYLFFVSRGMQGVFASGGIPAALGILGAAYPPGKRKNRVFATFSAGNPTGWVVGLLIGGFLTSYASWRWGFRVITIITAVVTVLSFIYIPPDPPRDPIRRKEKVDWLGAILIICGITGICYALSDAGNAPNGWRTWYIIFSLLLGCAFVGLFLWLESRVQYPLMPLSIWKVPQFLRLMVVIALGFSCFTGFLGFTWSLWFQQIDQASPLTV